MSVSAAAAPLAAMKSSADRLMARKRRIAITVPLLIVAYLAYIFFAFDIPGLSRRASLDHARALVSDTYSYKTHVTRDSRSGRVVVAIEGERKGIYPAGTSPGWVVTEGETTRIDLGRGYSVRYVGAEVFMTVPGYGEIHAARAHRAITLDLPAGPRPDWISASKTRVAITTPQGRLNITKSKSEVFRYAFGWELFFFTLDSPFHGKSPAALIALAVSGQRLVTGTSNIAAMAHDFWHNRMWQHGDVAWAMFETVLMAFLGTMGAALIALPLAFLAARNFAPLGALRFGVRRVFDFLRGVDGLIWTIILSRAFGPGPLTGSLAILLTDTGSFGKMFSEALENTDPRQIEGIRSTGAGPLQRYRFGVLPQILPVLVSQVLYYLESNTRSATIIGAITGGGIGLLLTQAMLTQKDWEEVTYYIILIIFTVMAMDSLSGWLRRKLIKGG